MTEYLVSYIFITDRISDKLYTLQESNVVVVNDGMTLKRYEQLLGDIFTKLVEKGINIQSKDDIIVRNIFKFNKTPKEKVVI